MLCFKYIDELFQLLGFFIASFVGLVIPLTDPIPDPRLVYGIPALLGEVIDLTRLEPYPIPETEARASDIELLIFPFLMYEDLLCLIFCLDDAIV